MSSYRAENLTERQWHFYQHNNNEELKSAERERHTVTSPKTFWPRWYSFLYRKLIQSYQVLTVESNLISIQFNMLFWLKSNKILSKITSYISIDF